MASEGCLLCSEDWKLPKVKLKGTHTWNKNVYIFRHEALEQGSVSIDELETSVCETKLSSCFQEPWISISIIKVYSFNYNLIYEKLLSLKINITSYPHMLRCQNIRPRFWLVVTNVDVRRQKQGEGWPRGMGGSHYRDKYSATDGPSIKTSSRLPWVTFPVTRVTCHKICEGGGGNLTSNSILIELAVPCWSPAD